MFEFATEEKSERIRWKKAVQIENWPQTFPPSYKILLPILFQNKYEEKKRHKETRILSA